MRDNHQRQQASADAEASTGKSSKGPMIIALVGSAIQLIVIVYTAYVCVEMILRYAETSPLRTDDPELMGYVISTIWFGGSLGLMGLCINFATAAFSRYRARWFFWASMLLSLPYLLVYPVGTILVLCFITYLLFKRREFLPGDITKENRRNQERGRRVLK